VCLGKMETKEWPVAGERRLKMTGTAICARLFVASVDVGKCWAGSVRASGLGRDRGRRGIYRLRDRKCGSKMDFRYRS
jgi:hypothetical protein